MKARSLPPDGDRSREILIVGLGSIGRRHLANLRAVGWQGIRLCRTGRSTLSEAPLAGIPVDYDLDTALARRPVAVIISNPTALHIPVAIKAARAGAHLLIEKPVSHDRYGVDELVRLVAAERLVTLVGFHFRFSPGLRQMKHWIETGAIGRVIAAHAHWGEYLPSMHPWEDYREGYAARESLGGGVLNTLCHPFDYLRWLFGNVSCVDAVQHRDDTLGLSVDTSVDVALGFPNDVEARVHLDFLQRPREHRLRVVGTEGSVAWSDADHAAHLYRVGSREAEPVPAPEAFERNTMFVDELCHFLACVRGGERPLCTLDDGLAVLDVVLAAKTAILRNSRLERAM